MYIYNNPIVAMYAVEMKKKGKKKMKGHLVRMP